MSLGAVLLGYATSLLLIIGSIPYWLALPYPAEELVQKVPADKWPKPGNISVVCDRLTHGLQNVHRIFEGQVLGSESVAVRSDGTLVMCDKYGVVWSANPTSSGAVEYKLNSTPVAYLGPGRPLGFHLDSSDNVIICDSVKGLTMLDWMRGSVVMLSSRVSDSSPRLPGAPINYANDLDIGADGAVYFSDSSHIKPAYNNKAGHWDTFDAYMLTMLQGVPSGKLLRYDPHTQTTTALLSGLWYANGVALSADESFVAVVETCSMRVTKYWLNGPKAGQQEVLIDGLPGFPDGLTRAEDGNFWVSLLVPPMPHLPALQQRVVRILYSWLPYDMRPIPKRWGAVVKVSPSGEVVDCLLDRQGEYVSDISSVTLHNSGRMFFGNLQGNYVSYMDVSEAAM